MKKFFMMVVALMLISTATFAGGNDVTVLKEIDNVPTYSKIFSDNNELNYDFNLNYYKLAYYLEINDETLFDVRSIHKSFCNGMMLASKAEDETSKTNLIYNSIDFELKNMRVILDDTQFHKFLRVFNISLQNRGFIKVVAEYGNRNQEKC